MSGKITNEELNDELLKKINDLHNFLTKGGNIDGGVTITNGGQTNHQYELLANPRGFFDLNYKNAGQFVDNIAQVDSSNLAFNRNLINMGGKQQTVGVEGSPWKDIFISGGSKSVNGYTKLPNGLILQWGRTSMEFWEEDDLISSDQTLPITFPTTGLFSSVSQYTDGDIYVGGRVTFGGHFIGTRSLAIGARRTLELFGYKEKTEAIWMVLGY